ncbi:MAG: endonuclease III domain-containing protein [Anaerolineae bacterium]
MKAGEQNAMQPPQAIDVHHTLREFFGPVGWRPALPAVDELVSTILSQSTTDLNRDRAFNRLRERFGSWEAVRDGEVADIEAAIRVAGLSKQKAPRIKAALQAITTAQGRLTLDFLRAMPVGEARAWLMQLKGVGIKTASIILLFSFDMPAFPVDTHVHRTTRRLGLIAAKTGAEKAHYLLEAALPPQTYLEAHLNLIRLGREFCRARRPACNACPLQRMCPSGAARSQR